MGDEHMSWCAGHHTNEGECEQTTTFELGETTTMILTGVPCSYGQAGLWVSEAWVNDLDELDRLIAELTAMRPVLQTTLTQADCTLHEHPDDEDEDDDE
jgi:hypothetical protein